MPELQVATLGNGCFWCTEAIFSEREGVKKVEPGYSGGTVPYPTSQEVWSGDTGHAEVAQITFDPSEVSYRQLLEVFFATHDPTTVDRQGWDEGSEYRSVIFYHDESQRLEAEGIIRELNMNKIFPHPIVTQVVPFKEFYPAETFHKEFYRRNPNADYCRIVIDPKLAKFRAQFGTNLKRSRVQ